MNIQILNDRYVNDDCCIPDDFICPLTLEMMEDPLMTRSGLNFEREVILKWLNQGNSTCPLTRTPLSPSMLVPNAALRNRIRQWQKTHQKDDALLLTLEDSDMVKILGMITQKTESSTTATTITDKVRKRLPKKLSRFNARQGRTA